MANYNEKEGVWRTIRGRRVFIKKGQSLDEAMKESGKFDDKRKVSNMIHTSGEEVNLDSEETKKSLQETKRKADEWREKHGQKPEFTDEEKGLDSKTNWREQIKANNEQMEKDVVNLENQINDFRNRSRQTTNAFESYQYLKEADRLQNEYYERFRENERANAKIKQELPNEKYESVDAYAGYKEKFNNTWGEDGQGTKTVSAKMYTNDEFMEHLTDANWHTERKMLEEAGLTNKQLEYVKNNTNVSAWSAELDKSKTEKLISEAKIKYPENGKAQERKEKIASNNGNKYATAKREGFGEYNKDNIPVYKNEIDYTGDFGRNANLSTLSNEELTTALNKQTELYKKALNENVGDQRTRNGRMNKIFNTAEKQKYESGTNAILEEMEKRNMPRYDIYNKENNMVMASSPTKEIADRNLKEMYETDKSLQKTYNWKKLPEYEIKENKKSVTERYSGTIEYLQKSTNMSDAEILKAIKEYAKKKKSNNGK